MSPSYEEDSSSDEDFSAKPKVIWKVKKKKKRSKVENVDIVLIKDLSINDREDVPEQQPNKVKDWTKLLMKESFQEGTRKRRYLLYLAPTISQGYLIPVISERFSKYALTTIKI